MGVILSDFGSIGKQNNAHMSTDNDAKFLGVLILLAPIINEEKSNRPFVREIVRLAEGKVPIIMNHNFSSLATKCFSA
jgi:hypothetical protein